MTKLTDRGDDLPDGMKHLLNFKPGAAHTDKQPLKHAATGQKPDLLLLVLQE